MAKENIRKADNLPKGIRLKNGSYEARARINGQDITLHSTDLNCLIRDFEAEKKRVKDLSGHEYTLDEWFAIWFDKIKRPKLKLSSVPVTSRKYPKTFGFYLGDKKLKDVTVFDIQSVINEIHDSGEYSDRYLKECLSLLRECMDFAAADKKISVNPCIAVEVPWKIKKSEETLPYTQEEENEFLNFCENEGNWYTELFYVLFCEGLRIGEAGALTWDDIDLTKNTLTVNKSLCSQYDNGMKILRVDKPKTINSYRTIPLLGEARKCLLSQKKKVDALKETLGDRWRADPSLGDLVFVTTMGSPTTRYIVEREINKVTDRINADRHFKNEKEGLSLPDFPHGHPHKFRHTFATRCFENGIDPKVVQKLCGHANISVTLNIYTHVMDLKQMEETVKFTPANTSDRETVVGESEITQIGDFKANKENKVNTEELPKTALGNF